MRLKDDSGLWRTVLYDSTATLEVSGSAGIGEALLIRGRQYSKYAQKTLDAVVAIITANGTVTHV